jgi:hypothetical protein
VIRITRYPDWPFRLTNYMDAATSRVAEWGVFDCALNCADMILAITGIDLAAQFRGQYDTEEGAFRELAKYGYSTTMDIASENFPVQAVSDLRSGDLAAFNVENTPILGVVYKGRIFVPAPGKRGMGSVGYLKAHTAYKVGD